MEDLNIEELLKSRRQNKSLDEGISSSNQKSRPRVINGLEVSTEGINFPDYEKKGKLPVVKPKTKEDAMLMKSGGKVSSASKRADGCVTKGRTKGRMV